MQRIAKHLLERFREILDPMLPGLEYRLGDRDDKYDGWRTFCIRDPLWRAGPLRLESLIWDVVPEFKPRLLYVSADVGLDEAQARAIAPEFRQLAPKLRDFARTCEEVERMGNRLASRLQHIIEPVLPGIEYEFWDYGVYRADILRFLDREGRYTRGQGGELPLAYLIGELLPELKHHVDDDVWLSKAEAQRVGRALLGRALPGSLLRWP
jgi:hypothetical protein